MTRCSPPTWIIYSASVVWSQRPARDFYWRSPYPHVVARPFAGPAPCRHDGRARARLGATLPVDVGNDYTRSSTTSYVRTFLRFLQWSGLNSQDLARFVPRTPCWRLAHLPPRLAWEDIQRAIDAIDVTTPPGMRDRALLLLLATTGLRNKEIRVTRASGYPLAHRRSACAANQGEARPGRAALERSGSGAGRLHPACQAEGRQPASVPVLCASRAPVQVPRLHFEDRPFAIGASRD